MSELGSGLEQDRQSQPPILILGDHDRSMLLGREPNKITWNAAAIQKIAAVNPDALALDGISPWVLEGTPSPSLSKRLFGMSFLDLTPTKKPIDIIAADIASLSPEQMVYEDENLAKVDFQTGVKTVLGASIISGIDAATYVGIGSLIHILGDKQELVSRRKFLKLAGKVSIGLGISKILSYAGAAQLSQPEADKFAIFLNNLAPNVTDAVNAEWFGTGRTALVTQKLLDYQNEIPDSKKVAMLFGAAHARNAPRVLSDEGYRLDRIRQYCQTAEKISFALLTQTGHSQQDATQLANEYIKSLANFSVAHFEGSDDTRKITRHTSEKIQKAIQ